MTSTLLDVPVGDTSTAEREYVAKGGKYLTFKLADEEYGLEILKVREQAD